MSVKSNVDNEKDGFIKRTTFAQAACKKQDEVGENLLISSMKRTALMHSAQVSVTFLPHLTAHRDARLSSRASSLVAALMLATQPHEARALRGAGGIGSTARLPLPAGNVLQAPAPGRPGWFAEGHCGQRSNVSSFPELLQYRPVC